VHSYLEGRVWVDLWVCSLCINGPTPSPSFFALTQEGVDQSFSSSNSTEILIRRFYAQNFITIGLVFEELSCIRPDGHTDRFYSLLFEYKKKHNRLRWISAQLSINKTAHFQRLCTWMSFDKTFDWKAPLVSSFWWKIKLSKIYDKLMSIKHHVFYFDLI
jgi:hypothetical protein